MQPITDVIYKNFKLVWLALTIILLLVSLDLNWHASMTRSSEKNSKVAKNRTNRIEGFIEDLFQDVYSLPVYGKELAGCQSGLSGLLGHITINNPHISGLIISDSQYHLICSTLPKNETFLSASTSSRTILGPYNSVNFDQPIYLIQQRMGNYYIGMIIISSLLKQMLEPKDKMVSSIALYNQFEKKNIIRIERNENSQSWEYSSNQPSPSSIDPEFMPAVEKLQAMNGVVLISFENETTVMRYLWYSQVIVFLLVLLASTLLYYILKNLITKHYSLRTAMKMALKHGNFYPVYQPVFDIKTDSFCGAEVLLRWEDNQDEIIMPDFFIEEAETTGLIVPISIQIINIAFKETQHILKQHPEFHLAFNLSALHFISPTFFNEFYRLVDQYSISSHQIILEITERDLLNKNDNMLITKMEELRCFGYSIAVDDYGTGHASISYLQHFPFNYLKIDKIFIQAIGTKAITESLNDAIIRMAKGLQLIIIAEGVETKEQEQYLTENDVRYLQGWYFSKAVAVDKLASMLTSDIQGTIRKENNNE